MTDQDVLNAVRGDRDLEKRLTAELKEIWRERELAFAQTHGRTPWCDCLMFEPGDFVEAKKRADGVHG